MEEVLHGFVRALRRGGLAVSPAETVDAFRAATLVGLEDRDALLAALSSTLAKNWGDREKVERLFEAYFALHPGRQDGSDLADRLRGRVSERTIAAILGLLGGGGLGAILGRPGELERLLQLAGLSARVEGMQSALQIGIFTHRMLAELGWPSLEEELAAVGRRLAEELGEEAGPAIDLLREELDRARALVRDEVQREFVRLHAGALGEMRQRLLEERDFASLSADESRAVREAVRKLAQKLKASESLRRKKERRGRFDARRTIRRSLATFGVPIRPQFRKRRRERPRLLLLCDISDSVRNVARLMLEFTYGVQEVFPRTRSFVFVSEIGEATELFRRHPVEAALGRVWAGEIVNAHASSSYGRSLAQFQRTFLDGLERPRLTTVVVLGDGRNNYQEPNAHVLDEIRRRCAHLLWLTPEGRAAWGFGDSVMHLYAPRCTAVHTVRNLATLRSAIDVIVRSARGG